MQTHRFYKEEHGGWYIDLPDYLEQGGAKGDLAMVAGADTMLDIIAQGRREVTITLDTEPFEGADELHLVRLAEMDGGYYFLRSFEGKEVNHEMWLCGVTEFVFGGMPERIFLREEASG